MIVIDISINREMNIINIGAVRINPRGKTEKGQMCTYEYGPIINNKVDKIGEFDFPYGDAIELTHHITGLIIKGIRNEK